MIDILAFSIKILLFLVGFYQLSRLSTFGLNFGLSCLAVALFMTGAEFVIPSETPWTYLFSDDSSARDVGEALLGGVIFGGGIFLILSAFVVTVRNDSQPLLSEGGRSLLHKKTDNPSRSDEYVVDGVQRYGAKGRGRVSEIEAATMQKRVERLEQQIEELVAHCNSLRKPNAHTR